MAWLVVDCRLGFAGAPGIEWIREIESPAVSTARVSRFKGWASQTEVVRKSTAMPE